MFFIEMFAIPKSYEKLRGVRIFATVGHSNDTSSHESQSLVKFVSKRFAIDRLSSAACAGWISALDHEAGYQAMEDSIVIVSVHAVLDEVSASEGGFSRPKFNFYLSLSGKEDYFATCGWFFLSCCRQIHQDYKSNNPKSFKYHLQIEDQTLPNLLQSISQQFVMAQLLVFILNIEMNQQQLNKIDNYFLLESQRRIEEPQDGGLLEMTTSKINKETNPVIQEISNSSANNAFKALKEEKNKKYKNETKTKWDNFQPYAFCKLPDSQKSQNFLQLFDDYLAIKIKLNEQIELNKKLNSRNHFLEAQLVKMKAKNGEKSTQKFRRQAADVNENQQLKQEVKRLHEKIVSLTGNKHKITQARPQSAAKTQKSIFPTNQNIKAELETERRQVRELLLIIDELKGTKFSLEAQLKEKQQNGNPSRVQKNNFVKDTNESQFQNYAFDLEKWKEKYNDLENCFNRMTDDKDRRIKHLELENLELKENERVKQSNNKFSRFTDVSNNHLEEKIADLEGEKDRLEKEVRRLVNLPFNQSNNSNKNQIDLQDKCSRLQLGLTKMKDELTKVKQSNTKYLAELEYKTKEGTMLKGDNEKLKKQIKELMQRQTNPKDLSMEIDYDDYYRKLMGVVRLEGDDPVWRKYANLAAPSFNNMNEVQLKQLAEQLWRSKLELLAHLQKAQIQLKTIRESSQSRIGLYLKDKANLEEELRIAHARLDEWTSMEKVGIRREVQLYEWAGIKYDDSISVFQAEQTELKQIQTTQNYFDLFLGQLNLDQTALLHNPSNKIKQIAQMVSFLTIDFYNHDTQHSHFVEGNARKIDNNFSFRVEMSQAIVKFMSKQTVTLELWSPQGSSTVLLGKGEIWLRDLVTNASKDVSAVIKGKCPFYQQDRSLIATLEYRIRMRLPIGAYCQWGREQGKLSKVSDLLRLGQKKRLEIRVIRATNLPSSSSTFIYFSLEGQDFFTEAVRGSSPEWNYKKEIELLMGEQLEEELKQNYLQFTVFDDEKQVNQDVIGIAKADITKLIDNAQQLDLDLDIKNKEFQQIGKLKVQFKWI